MIGIRWFKRYLPTSGDLVTRWRGHARLRSAGVGLEQALRGCERATRTYEGRHIFGALSMLGTSWWAIALHGKGDWPTLLAGNLLINGYPIMLQRYNRIRLQGALAHLESLRDKRASAGGQARQFMEN